MPSKRVLIVMMTMIALLSAACGGALEDGDPPSVTVTAEEQVQEPQSATVEPTSDGAEPTEEPEQAQAKQGSSEDKKNSCQDPFDGDQPSFPTRYWDKTNFCKHSVDYSSIISGGPPPDGIPPIDNPKFIGVESADEWLEEREPVISVTLQGEARAYPLQIMTWHEIANDRIKGEPVLVTFCPLCNTALVFERPSIDGQTLTFGTSGNLRHSDLVMYDRQTESWWQQFNGKAIVGDLTGRQLKFIPSAINSWGDFKANYPDGKVLSRDTGHNRRYGSNPYVGYDDVDSSPFLYQGETDDRLKPMARVVGILGEGDDSKSYSYDRLKEEKVIHDTLGDMPIVIFWKSGTASALDSGSIPEGKDVGSTGVFEAMVEGEELQFSQQEDGTFMDQQTNSTWNILGEAVAGPMKGKSLNSVPHHDTFWFAWAAFQPPQSLEQ